jgi:zinc protease
MHAVAFQAHPYRVPVIGWMNDLESMTVAGCTRLVRRWYAPNNAYVVVVGDVDHQDRFPAGRAVLRPAAGAPLPVAQAAGGTGAQAGIRRLTVKAPADLPVVMMAYKVPVIRDVDQDVDPYALDMLSAVLAGHDAARFSRPSGTRAASGGDAGASYDSTARGPGICSTCRARRAKGRRPCRTRSRLSRRNRAVQDRGVSAEELARAKAQLIAGQIYKLDSMFAQAMEIGQLESVGHSLQR